jgi:fatty acid desaturase
LAGKERVHARYAFVRVALFLVIVAMVIVGGVAAATWLIAPVWRLPCSRSRTHGCSTRAIARRQRSRSTNAGWRA